MHRLMTLALIVLASPLLAQDTAPENDSIRQTDLRANLYFLASDAMQGRLSNTPENRLTAEFIKSRFERMGLEPAGPNGSFYHAFNLMTSSLGDDNSLVISTPNRDAERALRLGQDYFPLSLSASGRARGELVFAGYGIVAPEQSHDDYRSGSIEGKIVVVLDHEPGERDPESPFDGVVTSEASRTRRKVLNAQERGAAAVLFVSDVHNHPGPGNFEASARGAWPAAPRRVPRYTLATWLDQVRIPAIQISPAVAESLVQRTGRTLHDLGQSAEAEGGVELLPLAGDDIELTTTVDRHVVPDRNVVAMIRGSDPDLADELVIVCAHYDHNGADDLRIFNGADDDGSGTVSLLIPRSAACSARGPTPRTRSCRSIGRSRS